MTFTCFGRTSAAQKGMECDHLLAQLLEDEGSAGARQTASPRTSGADGTVCGAVGTTVTTQRARLAAPVSGGQKIMFKLHTFTPKRIDAMEAAEIEELHACYEARLGAAISKSLGSFFCACMRAWHRCFHSCFFPGSQSSWLTSNKTRSSAMLFRVPVVSYTIATACI